MTWKKYVLLSMLWIAYVSIAWIAGCATTPNVELKIEKRPKPVSEWRVGVLTFSDPSKSTYHYAGTKGGPHLKYLADFTCSALRLAGIFRDVVRVDLPPNKLRENMISLREQRKLDAVVVGTVIKYECYTDGIPFFPSYGRGTLGIDLHIIDLRTGVTRINIPDFHGQFEGTVFRFGRSYLRRETIKVAMTKLVDCVEKRVAELTSYSTEHYARPEQHQETLLGTGRCYAVIMGVGKYQDSRVPELKLACADAKGVYQALLDTGWFKKDRIRLMLDSEVTQRSIRKVLGTEMARKLMPNDTLIVYFAGHGAPETDYSRAEKDGYAKYLLPYDADPTDLFSTAIPLAEVATYFDRIEAKNIIYISDSCYSGATGGRGFSMMKGRRGPAGTDGLEHLVHSMATGTARVVLSAADVNEPAMEVPQYGHGLFTYYLVQGLKGKADQNGDRDVDLQELYTYVYRNVLHDSKELGGLQHPVLRGEVRGKVLVSRLVKNTTP